MKKPTRILSPTKILSNEHQNILKIIKALIKECDALNGGKELNPLFFKKVIDFIRNYADKFHHAKEEDILFVELKKDTAQLHCNPTEQMLYEHSLGRNFVKNMEEGLKENKKDKVITNAQKYAQLLQEHIFKEDHILYPMADEALSQEIQEEMLNKFEQVENNQDIKRHLSLVKELEEK